MKMVKDKQILVAADFGGFELKEAVVKHLKERGWTVTDVGMKAGDTGEPEMYQRIGLRAGAMVAEGEFERALLFCGTGMGIDLKKRVGWIADFVIYPGEDELLALAQGGLRVMKGEEEAKAY